MSQCVAKLPHSCGTKSGLQVFANEDGSVSGYCFKCSEFVANPYGEPKKASDLPKPKVKTQEEIDTEIAEIEGYQTVDIVKKKLRKDTLNYYGVKVGLSEQDGKTPTTLFYPYYKNGRKCGYKIKVLEGKRFWSLGDLKGADLFGWNQALESGARRLIITEGEDDAISLRRVIELYSKKEFIDYTAVVSLPSGVKSAKETLSRFKKEIERFDEVTLCFDMDEPGQAAVKECSIAFPKFTTMNLPSKDANQCVIDGRAKALYNCLFKTKKAKNSRLISANERFQSAKEPPKFGELTWPWKHIDDITRGIRYGETIYIGAGVKQGKSEVLNALVAHFLQYHKVNVLAAKPEEDADHTVKLVAGKLVGKVFHDPKVEFDEDEFDRACEFMDDKLYMVDLYQHIGWESLKEDIRYAATELDVKAVFIDPITNLTAGINSGEANTLLEEISVELSSMAKDLNIVIFIFCHLKAHEGNISKEKREKYYRDHKFIGLGNCPHEMGGDTYSNQFAGSRSMMRSCHMMIGLEGNRDPEIPDEAGNTRHLKILEDRTFGARGVFPLYWNRKTSLFKEM